MITWKKISGGAFKAVLPGMIICVRCAYFRYNCSKRWGWILHYTDATVQAGDNWVYRVAARNARGTGTYSAPAGINFSGTGEPVAPTGLTGRGGNANAYLAWSAPGDSTITKYQYRIGASGTWTDVAGSDFTTTSTTITGLTNGAAITIYLRAVNPFGNGAASSVSVTPLATGAETVIWDSPTRLNTLAQIDTVFERDTSSNWQVDASGRAGSARANEGPGTNSGGPYVYSQRGNNVESAAAVTQKSTLEILSSKMSGWTGDNRQLLLRVSVQGFTWMSSGEGLEIQGQLEGSSDWMRIRLISGWDYSDSYSSGGIVSDREGVSRTLSLDGGWVDYATAISPAFAKVRIRNVPVIDTSSWIRTHIIGLWQVELATSISPPSRPERPAVGQESSGAVLSWDMPDSDGGSAITGYNVYRHDGDAWEEIEGNTGSTNTSYTDTSDLVQGRAYYYVVRAINDAGRGDWSEVVAFSTSSNVPAAPPRFTADAQSTGVVMSWVAPESDGGSAITGYEIWRYGDADGWTRIHTAGAAALAYTDTAALAEGAAFSYAIRAKNANGNGLWSQTDWVLINPSLPSAPRRFFVDAQSTGVVLAWLAPADDGTGGAVTGYNIWRHDGSSWSEIVEDTGNTNLTYTDSATLTVDSTYFYAIRAINASGEGEWSEVKRVLINPSVPSAPRRLTATETDAGVVLAWLAPTDAGLGGAVNGYSIWRYDEGGSWTEIVADTGNTNLAYTDAASLSDGWHWWAVRARNPSGRGEWSNTAGVTTATDVPSAVQALYAVEVATGVQLAWTAPASDGGAAITGYRIWRSDGSSWTQLVADTGSTDTTYIDTSISAQGHGIYFYRVNALTANGPGDFSAAAPVQYGPQTDGTSEAPTGLVALPGANGAIELSWVAPTNTGTGSITGYQIECWTPETEWAVCLDDTESTNTAHTLSQATATGVLLFRVAAITSAGVGVFSLPASILVDRLFGPAGGRKTLGNTSFYAPTLILPPATRYPVAMRNRRGHDALRSGLYDVQPEWWSWTSQGGSDSAAIQVAARNGPALQHALDWLDHEILIMQPGTGHVLWSGFVNSVTIPIGDFALRRSLDGYANDLRVQWTRPATEHEGAVDFVHSAANPEAAWQQARFGVRSVLVESDRTLVELDQDDVDQLLSEYQHAIGTARMEQDVPAGARLECRGHAGRLDQRYFPTRAAGQYGDVTTRDDDNAEKIEHRIDNNPQNPHTELYQYADMNPGANHGHGPRSPGWDQYLRRVRFYEVARFGSGTKQRFKLGLFALGTGNQPGSELSPERVEIGYQRAQNVPKSPSKKAISINWLADGDPLLKLPSAWYFGIEDDSGLHETGFQFDRSTARYWPDAKNSGRLLIVHDKNGNYTPQLDHLCFDFFTGVTAEGLAQWMASDEDLAQGLFGAHPANAAAGVYGAQVAQYHEGDTTWRQAIDQLAYADRLCYGIDAQKLLRFWSADSEKAEPLAWTGGGANLGAFIGRRVTIGNEEFLLTGASYDAMTGQVDFSSPGKPSATVAGARLGNVV